MTLKMHQITDFSSFFAKVKSQKLPFKTSYKLTLLAQEIEKHINYYQEQFRALLPDFLLPLMAFPLIPDDAASLRLHKNSSYQNEVLYVPYHHRPINISNI